MSTMSDHQLVRQQSFECDGPVDIDIELGSGTIEVRFADDDTDDTDDTDGTAGTGFTSDFDTDDGDDDTDDSFGADFDSDLDAADRADHGDRADHLSEREATPTDATATAQAGTAGPAAAPGRYGGGHVDSEQSTIMVEVRVAPRGPSGLSGLLNWVGTQLGSPPFGGSELAEQAVRETLIEVRGNRLSVHAPKNMQLRTVALSIVVHAPAGSSLNASCGSADVVVAGPAGEVRVDTGSGDVSVDRASGHARVKTGSGDLRLGAMHNGVSARSGSGGIEVSTLTGDGAVHSGSGDVWLGSVLGDKVTVRTGSGDLTVADAASGSLQLITGSGDLRIGIRRGVTAEIDVSSGSGRTRSDLPVSDSPPSGDTVLHLRARTGSGEAVIGTATA